MKGLMKSYSKGRSKVSYKITEIQFLFKESYKGSLLHPSPDRVNDTSKSKKRKLDLYFPRLKKLSGAKIGKVISILIIHVAVDIICTLQQNMNGCVESFKKYTLFSIK